MSYMKSSLLLPQTIVKHYKIIQKLVEEVWELYIFAKI